MRTAKIFGKCLDQPRLVGRLTQAMPAVLAGGGAYYTYAHVKSTPEKDKHKEFLKSLIVLGITIPSALLAPRIAFEATQKLFKKAEPEVKKIAEACEHEHEEGAPVNLKELEKDTKELVSNFLSKNKVSEVTENLLHKAENHVLGFKDLKSIADELEKTDDGKKFFNELIPEPENIDSNHLFGEIGRLSILGAVTVLGGILGGITADVATEKNWKSRIPDKIKEGSYQFLANIFLCNIGAGSALYALEKSSKFLDKCDKAGGPKSGIQKKMYNLLTKLNPQSKMTRGVSMVGGIILTGIVFGSAIANVISQKIINPILEHSASIETKKKLKQEKLYTERTPELLDISLHADDIATVAVLSGLKWIEPALPVFYSVSGYRAGIGYRNHKD